VFGIGPASGSANGTVRPETGPYGAKPYRTVPGSRPYRNTVYGRTLRYGAEPYKFLGIPRPSSVRGHSVS
jgi:hypothetical protein